MQRNVPRCDALACDEKDPQEEKSDTSRGAPEAAARAQAVHYAQRGISGFNAFQEHHHGKICAEIADNFLAPRSAQMVDAARSAILNRAGLRVSETIFARDAWQPLTVCDAGRTAGQPGGRNILVCFPVRSNRNLCRFGLSTNLEAAEAARSFRTPPCFSSAVSQRRRERCACQTIGRC
jgi:hypothetical protein